MADSHEEIPVLSIKELADMAADCFVVTLKHVNLNYAPRLILMDEQQAKEMYYWLYAEAKGCAIHAFRFSLVAKLHEFYKEYFFANTLLGKLKKLSEARGLELVPEDSSENNSDDEFEKWVEVQEAFDEKFKAIESLEGKLAELLNFIPEENKELFLLGFLRLLQELESDLDVKIFRF